MAGRCKSCGAAAVVTDSTTEGFPVCASCGVIQSFDLFHHQSFDSVGRALGSIAAPSQQSYRELRLLRAERTISDVTSLLGLSPHTSSLVRRLVHDVAGPKLGAGRWFDALIAACSVLAARQSRLPLSLPEAASAAGLDDTREVARVISRAARHLALDRLPSFDLHRSLDRCLRSSLPLLGLDPSKSDQIRLQATFLLTCCLKWSLSSGRHPLPLVAAVAAFTAEANGIATASVNDIAREILAAPSTARIRKKEIERTLVDAARKLLPWGNDVTTKNIVHHAPLLLRYMEIRSSSGALDLGTFCMRMREDDAGGDAAYFERLGNAEGGADGELMKEGFKLSAEKLSSSSKEALESCVLAKVSEEFGMDDGRKKRRRGGGSGGLEIDARMAGGPREEVPLERIGEVDVGFDVPPPAFVSGLEARERRREKMKAARARILKIMKPGASSEDVQIVELSLKKRGRSGRRKAVGDIDWEDCVIGLLLLHGVKEEEIEEGHYKRLLDLHIFNCLDARKVRSLQALLRKAGLSTGGGGV